MIGLLQRWRRRRLEGDRGVAMVEMAIVAPFLGLMMAGVLEYGTMWRDAHTVNTSTRAAARVVSNLGDSHLSDFEALLALNAGLATNSGFTIEHVLIYDGGVNTGEVPPACFDPSGNPQGIADLCNHYTAADLATVVGLTCDPSCAEFPVDCLGVPSMIFDYCPPDDRQTNPSAAGGLDSVGVWVQISRNYITGIFPGDGITIRDHTVMRVEPAIP